MEWLSRVGRERREENSGGRGLRELEMSERRAKSADGTDFERASFFFLSLSFVTFASFSKKNALPSFSSLFRFTSTPTPMVATKIVGYVRSAAASVLR